MKNRILFNVLNWICIGIIFAFLLAPMDERLIGIGNDPVFWPIVVNLVTPFNGGILFIVIGSLWILVILIFLTFNIIFQIKGKMQIGILITSLLVLVLFIYKSDNVFFIIPAAMSALCFLLHWTDFILRRKEKLSIN